MVWYRPEEVPRMMWLRRRYSMNERSFSSEEGAVLPIVALLIVVLLVFAAFTVDLGAAWGQRTLNQSAADAGVMGGGIGFIGDPPQTNWEIVYEVEKYVDLNLGYQISLVDSTPGADPYAQTLGGGAWAGCTDPKVTVTGEFYPLVDTDGNVINKCVSLSTTLTDSGQRIFRVVLPTQQTDTSFARIIGIDQIATAAFAEADLHFAAGGGGSLPFVVPSNAETSYCIGEMPPGLAQSPCSGSNTGKYGQIISPWHGTDDPGTPACTGDNQKALQSNIALGLDHQVRVAEFGDSHVLWPPAAGEDNCAGRDYGEFPYALVLGPADKFQAGMTGLGPYGTAAQLPGRLRQGGGVTRDIDDGGVDIPLDNVGLWEYLLTGDDAWDVPGDWCDGNNEAYTGDSTVPLLDFAGGARATEAIEKCLGLLPDRLPIDDPIPVFNEAAMLASPRFAIVPQLHMTADELIPATPNTVTNIKAFAPVYVQATYWNCDSNECNMRFRTYDDETADLVADVENDLENDQMFFSPGEGDEVSCLLKTNGKCSSNPNADMIGISVLVMNPKWVPQAIFTSGPASDVPIGIQMSG